MSTSSKIEWTETTWNPTVGCTRVSAGCDHCYAVRQSYRLEAMGQKPYRGLTVLNGAGDRHFNGVVRCLPERLEEPLRWRKPRRIFVNSMSDLFHEKAPFEFIDKVFAVMALCPQHTFQILTKRPERMAGYLADYGKRVHRWCDAAAELKGVPRRIFKEISEQREEEFYWEDIQVEGGGDILWNQVDSETDSGETPLRNAWLGASVEDQKAADERIPHLLRCPAAVRFLSVEPLLGPVDLDCGDRGIDWVIAGGESGPGARACNVEWVRSIMAQCKTADVPCFVKQLGSKPHEENDPEPSQCGCREWDCPHQSHRGAIVRLKLRDPKGGDPAEWPEDLRVREWPK